MPKVLVNISADMFDKVPTIAEQEASEDPAGTPDTTDDSEVDTVDTDDTDDVAEDSVAEVIPRYVIFESKSIESMFDKVAKKLVKLSKEQAIAEYRDPSLSLNINLSKESNRLLGFKSSLFSFLQKKWV